MIVWVICNKCRNKQKFNCVKGSPLNKKKICVYCGKGFTIKDYRTEVKKENAEKFYQN